MATADISDSPIATRTLRPLEPLLPGETRTECLDRLERAGENEQGQKHFGRIMMECSATAIRDAWRGAIVEVVDFPDDPANLIEQRGRLRQALFDIAGLLQKALIAAEPNNTNFILISEARNVARDALKSPNLVEANPEPPTTLPQVCPSCNQPYKDGETCKAGRGGCPMGGDL